ncbi:MAG: DedA family protein [candidate division Zixibacteria bacterium]|jgi:membrane protein DedA with SNARE-associated domain|nr:DedA family protein [candidate division Zixibacteria bacterium]
MFEAIIQPVAQWIINIISQMGYLGIVVTMGIESACIPLPSEIIMPFSGSLVSGGRFTMLGVSVAGALGCVLGSVVAYLAGYYGGRPFLEKYGKYILLSKKDIDTAEHWTRKYGDTAIFVSRLLPVVRTFISLPAGIARMNFIKFVLFTFLGSLPWCWALAYIGKVLGDNWTTLGKYFHQADIVIGLFIVAGIAFFVWHKFKK